jgi:hypothetical protein
VGANGRLVVLARPPQVSAYGTVSVSAEGRGMNVGVGANDWLVVLILARPSQVSV